MHSLLFDRRLGSKFCYHGGFVDASILLPWQKWQSSNCVNLNLENDSKIIFVKSLLVKKCKCPERDPKTTHTTTQHQNKYE